MRGGFLVFTLLAILFGLGSCKSSNKSNLSKAKPFLPQKVDVFSSVANSKIDDFSNLSVIFESITNSDHLISEGIISNFETSLSFAKIKKTKASNGFPISSFVRFKDDFLFIDDDGFLNVVSSSSANRSTTSSMQSSTEKSIKSWAQSPAGNLFKSSLKTKKVKVFNKNEVKNLTKAYISIKDDNLYILSNYGRLISFNIMDMSKVFDVKINDNFSSSLVVDSLFVYLKSSFDSIYALYDIDGKIGWTKSFPNPSTIISSQASPIVSEDLVFFLLNSEEVMVTNKTSGEDITKYDLYVSDNTQSFFEIHGITSAVNVESKNVIVATTVKSIVGLSSSLNSVKWSLNVDYPFIIGKLLDFVLIKAKEKVFIVNAFDGSIVWKMDDFYHPTDSKNYISESYSTSLNSLTSSSVEQNHSKGSAVELNNKDLNNKNNSVKTKSKKSNLDVGFSQKKCGDIVSGAMSLGNLSIFSEFGCVVTIDFNNFSSIVSTRKTSINFMSDYNINKPVLMDDGFYFFDRGGSFTKLELLKKQ